MKNSTLNYLIAILIFLITTSTNAANLNNTIKPLKFTPKNGDIFFQEGKLNSFTNAVNAVTVGYNGGNLSHVGIFFYDKKKSYIIEATDKVRKTPLENFLNRSRDKNGNPRVIVGRLKEKYQYLIPKALINAKKLVGLPYNDTFNINDSKSFYCSQVVYYSFKKANDEKAFFKLHPMTFKEPGLNHIFEIWQDYFKKLKAPVPEGEPGLNPGGISRSDKIAIVQIYGNISGMKNNQ